MKGKAGYIHSQMERRKKGTEDRVRKKESKASEKEINKFVMPNRIQ